MSTEPLPDPPQGFPHSIAVLNAALDDLITQQRNLLALLGQHSQEPPNVRRTAEVLESVRENSVQIVDVNRALWALGERGK